MLTVEERFWVKVEKTDYCWDWTGSRASQGYGQAYIAPPNVKVQAHRFAYEQLVGPIPKGLTIDHLCRNRMCVNPAHLEPVTCRENVLRGVGLTAANARKTECIRGHPLFGSNLYVRLDGSGRNCRACNKQRGRAHYARYKAMLALP